MPTPLELFFAVAANLAIPPSTKAIAVGTDNRHASPLLAGIQGMLAPGKMPLTLSRHLAVKRAGWSEKANEQWLQEMIAKPEIEKAHVFHDKIVAALDAAKGPDGKVDIAKFQGAYTGNTGPSYTEVMMLLKAGFTAFTLVAAGHAKLKR